MSKVEVRLTTVDAILYDSRFPGLAYDYKLESAIDGLPDPEPKFDQYRLMERTGALYPLGVYYEEKLIGFAALLMPVIPHYGVVIAVTESIFVEKDFRRTGAGLKLIRTAERMAKEADAPGIIISANVNSPLSKVLPRMGYRITNMAFFKETRVKLSI